MTAVADSICRVANKYTTSAYMMPCQHELCCLQFCKIRFFRCSNIAYLSRHNRLTHLCMKKIKIFLLASLYCISLNAWWDPGHLVTAMIAYLNLEAPAKKRVDELTAVLQRDYPYMNHFISTGPWPDDLKAEGVHFYDTWHYTNLPWNRSNVAIPDQPEVDVIWAINQSLDILRSDRSRDMEKARALAFLVHFVGDIHQPLHSTSVFTNEQAGGNVGGNAFALEGKWRNLHQLWDDGCGFLSDFNDVNPYGTAKDNLSREEIGRFEVLARQLMTEFPESSLTGIEWTDPDFWALESHKLAIKYGYHGVNSTNDAGRFVFLEPKGTPSELYLANGQKVVRERLAAGGYRLAKLLNEVLNK